MGDVDHVVWPGWCEGRRQVGGGGLWKDVLGYSFECEGNGLQILNYYRIEGIEDAEWARLSLDERYSRIKGNWCLLKVRLSEKYLPTKFPWMNRNLTIEDAGFLWEVNYGGNTPGYTIDVEHLIHEMNRVVYAGLSTADREMDSGFQVHLSFPFMREESLSIRETVLCLGVHADDFLFLHSFDRSIIDDCNNMWLNDDVTDVLSACHTPDALSRLVSFSGGGGKQMPNPKVKHKHIGLRGGDAYSQKYGGRYGFELRRGPLDERQLFDLVRFFSRTLQEIGVDKKGKIQIRRSMCGQSMGDGYGWNDMIQFVKNVRVVSDSAFEKEEAGFIERLDTVCQIWVEQIIQWEYHLRYAKQSIWRSAPTEIAADKEFEAATLKKIRHRLGFLLVTDWSQFPSPMASILAQEQAHLRNRIRAVPPQSSITQLSAAQMRVLTAQLGELRLNLSDFARRLSTMY